MSDQSRETVGKVVPVGYKQTEVGVIPEDWDCLDFSDIFTCRQGMQVPVEKQSFFESTNTVRFIRIIDLTDKQEPPRYISNPGDKYVIKKTDLFMVRYGVPGLIGFNYQGVIANNLFRIIPRMSCSTSFYAHYLSYRNKDILDSSGSSTMPAISFSTLARFKIIKPQNEKEQTAIANTLSDVDALISEQEKLIAKKQAIKTATMQQLLTGRTRLPQFALREDGTPKGTKPSELGEIPEDWEVRTIAELGRVSTGGTPSTSSSVLWNGDIPWITPTDISHSKNIYSSERKISQKGLQSIRQLPANSLLVTCIASIGKNAILRRDGACNQQINAVVPNEDIDVDLLFYAIELSNDRLKSSAGITATLIVSKALFEEFHLLVPACPQEQTAIATILSDMDAEIQALEQRLGKTRQIKQGMMQELLTGKTRLIKEEAHG